ncbi:MAG: acyl carrier protein [Candidatus Paceibacterota bacterium]|jgi:acyl carrier protein
MKDFNTLVVEHFKLTPADITDTLSSRDVPEWDSMNYLLFIAALEKEFNISFTMDEVLGIATLGDVRKLLEGKKASV